MACLCGGAMRSQQIVKEFYMKEFLISKGWTYTGTCGCTPPMASYSNVTHKDWEFSIGTAHFNLKKKNAVGVKNVVASGRLDTIEVIYNTHFK